MVSKKEKYIIDRTDTIATFSRACLNCGSLRIFITPELFIMDYKKIEQGIKCSAKICLSCGHIEFFESSVLKKRLKDMRKYPVRYTMLRGKAVLKGLLSPFKWILYVFQIRK